MSKAASPGDEGMADLLSARFRAGMRPLALGTALTVALSAPLADFLFERHDLQRRADLQSEEVARRLATLERGRGALSAAEVRVGIAAAMAHLGAADVVSVEVLEAGGGLVADWRGTPSWPAVRASAALSGERRVRASVGERGWLGRDLLLLAIFGILGALLGLASYLFPLRLFREEDLVRLFGRRSIQAAEEERLSLSRELHDGVGQALGAAAVAVVRWSEASGRAPEAAEAGRLIDGALGEVRRVARGLRPPSLDDLGLGPAVEALVREAGRSGLVTETRIEELPALDPDVAQTCYRLAQEALANVVRHALATRVLVSLRLRDERVVLEVEDDGRGFSPSGQVGLGLVGARERAARLEGSVRIESAPGRGTRLLATLPARLPA